MSSGKLAAVALAVTVLAAIGVRAPETFDKRTLTHDEAISLLAATCHHVESFAPAAAAGSYPVGRWVPASEWQRVLLPERPFCFEQIGADLARLDVHPPLYFWLLHVWVLAVGMSVWSGPALNVAIAALTAVALFGLARQVLGDRLEAVLVVLVWALSASAVLVSVETRQYELLALVAVVFVWQVVRHADPNVGKGPLLPRLPRAAARSVALAASTAAGALTHYAFAMLVAGGLVFLTAKLARTAPARLASATASIAAGAAAFIALHPDFQLSLGRIRRQTLAYQATHPGPSGRNAVTSVAGFLVPEGLADSMWTYAALTLLAACLLAAASAWLLSRRATPEGRKAPIPTGSAALFFAVWMLGAHLALYFALGAPLGAKYLSGAWPFVAFLPVLALRPARRLRPALTVALCVLVVASGTASALEQREGERALSDPSSALRIADAVVVDDVTRGFVPRVLWHVPAARPVLVAPRRLLLDDLDRRVRRRGETVLYVAGESPGSGNTPSELRQLLRLAGRERQVVQIAGGVWGGGRLFELRRRPEGLELRRRPEGP